MLLVIESDTCERQCCSANRGFKLHVLDNNNQVMTPDLQKRVGCVAKQWKGCCAESFTDADTFSVTFPGDMTVECKILFFGPCFMVDYIHFEGGGGGGGCGGG